MSIVESLTDSCSEGLAMIFEGREIPGRYLTFS